jgi:predicted nucleic acid-binding protein
MRGRSSEKLVSPKVRADAYLAAFAVTGNLTLVTMDRALAAKVKCAVLLG